MLRNLANINRQPRTKWGRPHPSPPGPEFDPDVAAEPPRHKVDHSPFAAVYFGKPCHHRLEKEGVIVELSGDQDRRPSSFFLFGRAGGDRDNRPMEAFLRVRPELEDNPAPQPHIGDFFLRD